MFTENMPVLLAEYEKLPATGKSDQFLAGGCVIHPETVAVTRSRRQMATMHHPP